MSRRCYDVGFKLRAVAITEAKTKEAAARELKVETANGAIKKRN